ncbi:MAG: BREX system ATP-binding domain-containing protein [Myxococcota bacterium]
MTRPSARLVGRRRSLRWLLQALDEVGAGSPRFVLISGEAGIGKSRLAEAAASEAASRGFSVVHARCEENHQRPYGPLLTSLFPRLREVAPDAAATARTDVALRTLLGEPAPEPPPPEGTHASSEAGDHGVRLLLELIDLTVGLARQEPLLLLVDDLAWADRSTFRLVLRLVERGADLERREPVPLLVVATMRPELEAERRRELDRSQRQERCATLELEGLELLETAELLRELGVPSVSTQLAERVQRATSGSPLFVEAVARRLLSEGGDASGPVDDAMPREIRDAIGDALEGLSPPTRALLRVASVVGPVCDLDELDVLARNGADHFEDAVEEAQRHGLVEVAGDVLSFRHPLYRSYLYHSLRPTRRRHLHAQIADRRAKQRQAVGLAEHLIAAGPEEAPARVARACAAAREAAGVYAWSEASRFYAQAIQAEERAPGVFEPEEFAALLYDAGLVADFALDADSAVRWLGRAAELFSSVGDEAGRVETLLARVRSIVAHQPEESSFREASDALMSALDKLSGHEELRAAAMNALSELAYARGDFAAATELGQKALAASRACGSLPVAVRAQQSLALTAMIQLELRDSLELLERSREDARGGNPELVALASIREPLLRFWLGQLSEATSQANVALEYCQRANEPLYRTLALAAAACAAMARGDHPAADEHVYDVLLLQRLSGYTWVSGMYLPAFASFQARRGEFAAARQTLADITEPADGSWRLPSIASWYADLYVRARAGSLEEVRREIEEHPRRVALEPWPFLGPASWAGALVEIADLLGTPELARPCVPVLEAALERGQRFTAGLLFHVPRVLGTAERLLGASEAAITRLQRAAEDTAASGAWVDHALALRELARALAESGDAERAHARSVALTARDAIAGLGLEAELPAVEQLLSRLGAEVRAEDQPGAAGPPLAILFTDVEGSTPLVERLGDAEAYALLRAHERVVREQLAAWGGHEVDQEGDSFFATFDSGEHAARCALAIQRGLARLPLGRTIRVRIGIHWGEVLRERDRVFGLNVIQASRIADAAQAGEILISDALRAAIGGAAMLRFGPGRDIELKGLSGRTRVRTLHRSNEAAAS